MGTQENRTFKDAYDRIIQMGDVIISGARVGCIGSVRTCIVTGFTTKSVTVLAIIKQGNQWMLAKSYIKATEHCVITTHTQQSIMNELNISHPIGL